MINAVLGHTDGEMEVWISDEAGGSIKIPLAALRTITEKLYADAERLEAPGAAGGHDHHRKVAPPHWSDPVPGHIRCGCWSCGPGGSSTWTRVDE